MKKSNPIIVFDIVKNALELIEARTIELKATYHVGCDMGCLMNIEGMLSRKGSDIKIMHIAQILAG